MNATDEFFARDEWARGAGIELVDVSPGRATVRMAVEERHKNSHGTVHGGALFTLADAAFALASNSHGVPAAAINAHISYVTATREGDPARDRGGVLAQPQDRHLHGDDHGR